MLLQLTTAQNGKIMINTKYILTVLFDADPEHRTIITFMNGDIITVINGINDFYFL